MDEIDGTFVLTQIISYGLIFTLIVLPVLLGTIFIGRWLRGDQNPAFNSPDAIFTFRGRGTQVTPSFELRPSAYKLQYQFPADASTKIDLISLDDGDSETLFIKAGTGSQALTIESAARYAFQVEPVNEQAEWLLEISPLGLPSQRH